MRCQSGRKIDENPRTALKNVGLALLMARLLYLQRNGYWSHSQFALSDFISEVLNHYRRAAGLTEGIQAYGMDALSFAEGALILELSPIRLEPVAIPSEES